MASGLERVIDHVQLMVSSAEINAEPDARLLKRFLATQDQASFALLVRKHGPMVLGVCKRILGNHHDAEDAFQATFMVLARKAALIRKSSVTSWLHTVALRTALAAREANAMRMKREKQVINLPERESLPTPVNDWRPVLDLELANLAEIHRGPLVLCDLQGVSRKEAASRLEIPEGTLSSRLNRARSLLAARLERHGVMLSAGVLASAVCSHASAAVPRDLVMRTTKSALLAASDHLAAASTPAGNLMTQMLKEMLMTKIRGVTGAVGVIAALALGGLDAVFGQQSNFPGSSASDKQIPQAIKAEDSKNQQADLLRTVIRGHLANRQAIRSIHAQIRVVTAGSRSNSVRQQSGEWWEGEGKISWQEKITSDHTNEGSVDDYLVEGEKTYKLASRPGNFGATTLTGRIIETSPGQSFLDVWNRMGFTTERDPRQLIVDILKDIDWSKSVRTEMVGKAEFVAIDCQKEATTIKLLLSLSQGYLVTHMEILGGPKRDEINFRMLLEVDDIQECEPGVFFPIHSIRTIQFGRQLEGMSVKTESFIDFLEINKPIPKSRFEPLIPEGVRTTDSINGTQYIMGPDGKPSPDYPIELLKDGQMVRRKPPR